MTDLDGFQWHDFLDPGTMPGALLLALVLIIVTAIISRLLTRLLEGKSWAVGRLKRSVDQTVVRYVVHMKTGLLFLLAGFIYISLIPQLRAWVTTVLAGAGITALVLGFAAKPTLSNFVSGVALAFYRPFRIGDKISIDDQYCTVEDITMRHTIVQTWQNKRLIIPNEKIDQMSIVNYDIVDRRILCTVEMGVSYDTDMDLARKLILEQVDACPYRLRGAQEPWVRVVEWGDFYITMRAYLWTPEMDSAWQAKFWLLEHVKKSFDAHGVEIPFPYRTLVFKNDLPPAPTLDGRPDQETPKEG